MATAPPVVPSLPTPTPDRFGGEEFDTQMQAWLSAFPGWTAGANNLATWSNTTAAEVATLAATANTKAWEANASADAAWASRLAAQGYSDSALGYRNEANAYKDAASGSAAAANTSAGIASTKAGEAAASAASIAGGPVASLVGLTGAITQAQFNTTVAPSLPISTATQAGLNAKASLAGATFNALEVAGPNAELLVTRNNFAFTAQTTYRQVNTHRWATGIEGGVAADYFIARYNDAGTYVDTPFRISRPSGIATFQHIPTAPTATAADYSAQLATTAFVKNQGYAPLASPTFTGTVSGVTKAMVGLGNVDNTSDANKPLSTATQTALNTKFDKTGGTVFGDMSVTGTTYLSSIGFRNATTLPQWTAAIASAVSGSSYAGWGGPDAQPFLQTEALAGDKAIWWMRHAAVGAGYSCAIGCYGDINSESRFRVQLPATNYDFSATNAYKSGGGSWADTSDERTKENIQAWATGLSELMQLKVRRWNFRKETGRDVAQEFVGLVAQEAELVAPRLVSKRAGELGSLKFDDLRSVDPSDLVYMLVNSVQEQQRTIEGLQVRIAALESKQ